MTRFICSILLIALIGPFGGLRADDMDDATAAGFGSNVGNVINAWQEAKQSIARFNRRYFELKNRLKQCNGCSQEKALRQELHTMKYAVDLDYALSDYVVPDLMSGFREQERLRKALMKSAGRLGDGIPRQCYRQHKSWGKCLAKEIGSVSLNPVVMARRNQAALLRCTVSYKQYWSCRENTPVTLTQLEKKQLRRETGRSTSSDMLSQAFKNVENDTTRFIDKLYGYPGAAGSWVVSYGLPVLESSVAQFKQRGTKDKNVFLTLADKQLGKRIQNKKPYSYVMPGSTGILYTLAQQHKEMIISRYNSDPYDPAIKRLRSSGYSSSAFSILQWPNSRSKKARGWARALLGSKIMACHYSNKVAYYWYRQRPRANIIAITEYVIDNPQTQCPPTPGNRAVHRRIEDQKTYLAKKNRPRFFRDPQHLQKLAKYKGKWIVNIGGKPHVYGIPLMTRELSKAKAVLGSYGFKVGQSRCNTVRNRYRSNPLRCSTYVRERKEGIELIGTASRNIIESIKYHHRLYPDGPNKVKAMFTSMFGKPTSVSSQNTLGQARLRLRYEIGKNTGYRYGVSVNLIQNRDRTRKRDRKRKRKPGELKWADNYTLTVQLNMLRFSKKSYPKVLDSHEVSKLSARK